MFSLPSIAFQVTLTGLALGGFTSNVFIIAVIIIEWAKSRSLNSTELLLLSLGVSNIWTTVSLSVCVVAQIHSRYLLTSRAVYICWNIAMLSRFWFTAWLCVFYCVKIVNSSHSLLLWCKQRIQWLLPWILVASAASSILSSVFSLHFVPVHLQSNTTTLNITDEAQEELKIRALPSFITFFLVIGSACPLFVVLLCSIVIVASLCRHVCQMTGKESSFRNFQTEAHFKAAGTVLFLLFLYLSFYIAQILVAMKSAEDNTVASSVCSLVIMGYSLAQAAVLVWVNPKLKQAVSRMLPGRKP